MVGKIGLGQAEQNCTLCLHIISCLYCAVQLPGARLASKLSTIGLLAHARAKIWSYLEIGTHFRKIVGFYEEKIEKLEKSFSLEDPNDTPKQL